MARLQSILLAACAASALASLGGPAEARAPASVQCGAEIGSVYGAQLWCLGIKHLSRDFSLVVSSPWGLKNLRTPLNNLKP